MKDQNGSEVTLASFKGQKNVVVYFYPKDATVSKQYLLNRGYGGGGQSRRLLVVIVLFSLDFLPCLSTCARPEGVLWLFSLLYAL